jgi:hypothetical protein
MCRSILAVDKRFSEVHPRHPRGGPDGGRDIEATYRQEHKAFGAVGFLNQANDSCEQKRRLERKFKADVESALVGGHSPYAFVFLTNVGLTVSEKDTMIAFAKNKGFKECEVMDRERLRITLDSPDGFAIRYQYLNIPLSEAEQATFFAKWGDDINSIISTGFQTVERTLDRILFLQEASEVLTSLVFAFQLNRVYDADEIGHFRAFVSMFLKEPKLNIFSILFGSSDRSDRMMPQYGRDWRKQPTGIRHGICGGQWEMYMDLRRATRSKVTKHKHTPLSYKAAGSSAAIGMDKVEFIPIHYNRDQWLRIQPSLKVCDFDRATFTPFVNSSLASKLQAIHIYAGNYKIQEISRSAFQIGPPNDNPKIPLDFTNDELADAWVRIRPSGFASAFCISFSDQTPRRLFEPPAASDSLATRRRTKMRDTSRDT